MMPVLSEDHIKQVALDSSASVRHLVTRGPEISRTVRDWIVVEDTDGITQVYRPVSAAMG